MEQLTYDQKVKIMELAGGDIGEYKKMITAIVGYEPEAEKK